MPAQVQVLITVYSIKAKCSREYDNTLFFVVDSLAGGGIILCYHDQRNLLTIPVRYVKLYIMLHCQSTLTENSDTQ